MGHSTQWDSEKHSASSVPTDTISGISRTDTEKSSAKAAAKKLQQSIYEQAYSRSSLRNIMIGLDLVEF
jgi:hypothetical protein